MKFAQRVFAAVLALSLFAAPALAFSLPSGFTFSDAAPTGAFKAVVLAETTAFYTVGGQTATLERGTKLTVWGMQNDEYCKVTYGSVKGYVKTKDVMSLTGVSAYARTDCWAYEYAGDQKARVPFGTKVYVVGRMTDPNGTLWLLCTDKGGNALAYIKSANLYR